MFAGARGGTKMCVAGIVVNEPSGRRFRLPTSFYVLAARNSRRTVSH